MTRFVVNGSEHVVASGSGVTLLGVLRDDLGLTGAKYGCGEGRCGACTVLVNGAPARACTLAVAAVDGAAVTTVEALAREGTLHPVQRSFVDARALQCGYCTPGMVMSSVALLAGNPDPDEAQVREALAGTICRCGGYPNIVRAVRGAAAALREAPELSAEADATPGRAAAASGGERVVWEAVLTLPDEARGSRGWGWSTPGGARLTVDEQGRVTAFTGKVDGGQGNREALTRLVAAELCVPTSAVQLTMGDTAVAPFDLGTFGSRSTPDAGHALRLVAAAAHTALLDEAARTWQVAAGDVTADGGAVHDGRGARSLGYGELVAAAGARRIEVDPDRPVDGAPPGLGAVDAATLRRQLRSAVTGRKRFPSDLKLPGMLHGRVLRPPAHGAVLRRVDTDAARRLAAVTVVDDDGFVAVAAPTREDADRALAAVRAEWDLVAQPSEAELEDYLRGHPAEQPGWGGSVDQRGR